MTQGCRAAEGPTAAHTGALLTGDGVSELCDHLLTDRHLKEEKEGGRKEGKTEGKEAKVGGAPQTQSRQAAEQDGGKAVRK